MKKKTVIPISLQIFQCSSARVRDIEFYEHTFVLSVLNRNTAMDAKCIFTEKGTMIHTKHLLWREEITSAFKIVP